MIIAELNMTTILANMQIFLNRIERKTRHHTDAKYAKMNNSIFISFFQRNSNLQVKETKIDVCFPSLSAEIRWGNTEMHYYKTTWISTTLSSGRKNTKNRNFLKRMQETWSNDWIKTNNSTNIFQRYTWQYKFYIENWICWKNTLLFSFPVSLPLTSFSFLLFVKFCKYCSNTYFRTFSKEILSTFLLSLALASYNVSFPCIPTEVQCACCLLSAMIGTWYW